MPCRLCWLWGQQLHLKCC